jgi:hypothetical protein
LVGDLGGKNSEEICRLPDNIKIGRNIMGCGLNSSGSGQGLQVLVSKVELI